jgi:hypothetical protein
VKNPAQELRETLHRAADLIADLIEGQAQAPRAKRRVGGSVPVDDVSRKFAESTLIRLGWPIPQKRKPGA